MKLVSQALLLATCIGEIPISKYYLTNCVVNVAVTQCCRKQEQKGAAIEALQHNFDLRKLR